MRACKSAGRVALLIPRRRNNQWTIRSRSEIVGTLLCLSCLTTSSACWRKPSPSQTGDCSRKPWRPSKETQTSGALTPQTPCSHRGASQFPCQATTFVCPPLRSLNCPTERTHPRRPWCFSEEGVGSRRALNATQSPLCVTGTKGPVRVKEWEWAGWSSAQALGWSWPAAGNVLSGYLFPMELES